jgi:hypothetical protein
MTPSIEAEPGVEEGVSRMGWVLCWAVGGGRRFRISNPFVLAACRKRCVAAALFGLAPRISGVFLRHLHRSVCDGAITPHLPNVKKSRAFVLQFFI